MSKDINEVMRSSAMLVTYHTQAWSGQLNDVAAAKAVAEATGAPQSAYRVGKNLLHGHDERLKAVKSAQETGRREHQALTAPWGLDGNSRGARLLSVTNWQPYTKAVGKARHDYNAALEEFISHFPDDAAAAAAVLKIPDNMIPRLYPSATSLRNHFTIKVDFQPIPAGSQFTGLPDGVAKALNDSYEDRMKQRVDNALGDIYEKLRAHVGDLAERLKSDNSRYRSATLKQIGDVASLLKSFDLGFDGRMGELATMCAQLADGYSYKKLNTDSEHREAARTEAQAIVDKMDSWGL